MRIFPLIWLMLSVVWLRFSWACVRQELPRRRDAPVTGGRHSYSEAWLPPRLPARYNALRNAWLERREHRQNICYVGLGDGRPYAQASQRMKQTERRPDDVSSKPRTEQRHILLHKWYAVDYSGNTPLCTRHRRNSYIDQSHLDRGSRSRQRKTRQREHEPMEKKFSQD